MPYVLSMPSICRVEVEGGGKVLDGVRRRVRKRVVNHPSSTAPVFALLCFPIFFLNRDDFFFVLVVDVDHGETRR